MRCHWQIKCIPTARPKKSWFSTSTVAWNIAWSIGKLPALSTISNFNTLHPSIAHRLRLARFAVFQLGQLQTTIPHHDDQRPPQRRSPWEASSGRSSVHRAERRKGTGTTSILRTSLHSRTGDPPYWDVLGLPKLSVRGKWPYAVQLNLEHGHPRPPTVAAYASLT